MSIDKAKFGYCALTADFFHIGHLNFLKRCKERCENLIVGVMTDDCVKQYKGRLPIMDYEARKRIIESLKIVFKVRPQNTFIFPHDIIRMKEFYEKDFIIFDNQKNKREYVDIYFPYLEGISSTKFKKEYLL